jgi:hypothetical protein
MVTAIANALFEALDAAIADYIILFNPIDLITALSAWIWDEPANLDMANLAGYWYALAVIATVALSGLLMYRRYLADE